MPKLKGPKKVLREKIPASALTKEQRKARRQAKREKKQLEKEHRLSMDAKISSVAPVLTPDPSHHVNGNKGRVERPYVARSISGNTSIVLFRARTKVYHVPMEPDGLSVKRTPMDTFDNFYKPWEYSRGIQFAAQSYLDWAKHYQGITDVAHDALTAITKGEVDMSTVENTTPNQSEPIKPNGTETAKAAKAKAVKTAKKEAKKPSKAVVSTPKAAAEAKAKAKPKTAKTAKPKKTKGEGRQTVDPTLKIKKLAKENPRREGSNRAARFDAYREGMTVAKALENEAVSGRGLLQDQEDGLIKLVK